MEFLFFSLDFTSTLMNRNVSKPDHQLMTKQDASERRRIALALITKPPASVSDASTMILKVFLKEFSSIWCWIVIFALNIRWNNFTCTCRLRTSEDVNKLKNFNVACHLRWWMGTNHSRSWVFWLSDGIKASTKEGLFNYRKLREWNRHEMV